MSNNDFNVKRSKNFLKNIKMTTLLFALIGIAVIPLIAVSLLALSEMKILSADINNLYNDRMLPSLELKHLQTEFYSLNLLVAQMVYSNTYDANAENSIKEKEDSLTKIFDKYRNSEMNDEQKKLFNDIETSYNAYIENVQMLLEKLKSNTTINAQEIAKLVELTSNTQNNIEALVKLNAETAANVVDKANLAYSKSKVIF